MVCLTGELAGPLAALRGRSSTEALGCSPHRVAVGLLLCLSGTLASTSMSSASPQGAPAYLTICPALYVPKSEVAVPDGRGGALVAWVDHRVDPEGDIYIQRLDDKGRPMWIQDGV